MSIQAVLLPLFVEVTLTFVLLVWMACLRTSAINSGAVRPGDIALREPGWLAQLLRSPMHFTISRAACPFLCAHDTGLDYRDADYLFVVMAWIFVLSRLGQAFIHTTSNDVRVRGAVFGVGAIVLALMWLIFMFRILLGLG